MNPKNATLCTTLSRQRLDGLIVSTPSNISYLVGFPSQDAYAIISKHANIYITDSRYSQEVAKQLIDCNLATIKGPVFGTIAQSCRKLGLQRIGFEERHLSYAEYQKIKDYLGEGIELIPTHSLIEGLRIIKSSLELRKIKKATLIAVKALEHIRHFLRPGLKEIEVAGELERLIRIHGGHASSFDIIVAAGAHASCPHHRTGNTRIAPGEPVLIDMGVDYEGYKSDLTRMFFLGKINVLAKKIYDIALQAQHRALRKIKPGVPINEIDHAARHFITDKGFGRYFLHNLGHGIGLDVHEDPHISAKEKALFKAGMVCTVEPGIYLPGKCGVRIEDMVVVTQEGVEILSGSLNK